LIVSVNSHASMMIPTTRNAMDRNLPQFKGGKAPFTPCTCANGFGGPYAPEKGCDMGVRTEGGGGQPCLWWSQGCSIGCEVCTTNMTADGKHPTTPVLGNLPHTDKSGFRKSYCDNPKTGPVLPKYNTKGDLLWTMNIHAVPGAVNDSYRYNPWRAPGSAPVVDACGQAGGKYKETPVGGDSVYTDTIYAKMGDMGSQLPPTLNNPNWTIGSSVRVAWGMRYNHGGGYQYRLCPADKPLTESCFQENALQFDRKAQAIMWNNGTMYPINGVFVDDSDCPVVPSGSTWARNPIPRVNTDNRGLANVTNCNNTGRNGGRFLPNCQQFPSICPEDTGTYSWSTDGSGQGLCSGDWTIGMISDKVIIPTTLNPGKYVLSWRYDCEETAQVWQNCADVNLVEPSSA